MHNLLEQFTGPEPDRNDKAIVNRKYSRRDNFAQEQLRAGTTPRSDNLASA